MPSVSPSDGGYNYYQRTISELEDELQLEATRARERERERSNALEERYRAAISERDRDVEETVNDIKENANEYVTRDREYSKAELNRIRNQTYDRQGRFNSDNEISKKQLEDLQKTVEASNDRSRAQLAAAEERHLANIDDFYKQNNEKTEQAVRSARDTALADAGKSLENERDDAARFRAEVQDRYETLNKSHKEELNTQRRQVERAIQETREDFEHRADKTAETTAAKLARREKEDERRLTDDTRNLNRTHAENSRALRDQIGSLLEVEKTFNKDRAAGTSQAIQEYENEWRARERMANDTYQDELANIKRKAHESDQYFNHLNSRNLRDKDGYFTGVIAKQNIENREAQKELLETFDRDRANLEQRMAAERKQSSEIVRSEAAEASRQRAVALEDQARAYENTIRQQQAASNETIDTLQRDARQKSTSSDTALISPAAETAVRRSVASQYEKTFQAERERHDRSVDSVQKEYSNRLRESVLEKDAQGAKMAHDQIAARQQDRTQFLNHIHETEFLRDTTLRDKEIEYRREAENVSRNHALILERQRREYDEMLQTQREDANARILSIRQDADFKYKMAQRAFSATQNELIRDYDKKLADQKQDFDAQMETLKAQNQHLLREGERKNRQLLDEQAKGYEQRIAQLEYQHKERERYITQNYQEDLEKMKRSNALLIQKKS